MAYFKGSVDGKTVLPESAKTNILSTMELIYSGKTKDVYKLPDGNYSLLFRDTVTGHPSGESDPGGNVVIGSVAGVGSGALKMSAYYFELLKKQGILTHFVSADLSKNTMTVLPAKVFGKGLEFVVRYKATGSFIRRFGDYCEEGAPLPKVFEVTLKDDARDDPPATGEILAAVNLVSLAQFDEIKSQVVKVCDIIKEDLHGRGCELYDIKLEFGLVDGKIALIDEISAGNMRVYKDGKKLDYLTLSEMI
jgi:phosphoribosylaminoimidazole-succinocarboxamide synthase